MQPALMTPAEQPQGSRPAVNAPRWVRPRPVREAGQHVSEAHRLRILAAMAQLVSEHGIQGVSVSRVVASATVSRRTFYLLFENRDDCLDAVLEEAVALAAERVEPAYHSGNTWVESLR